MPVLSPHRSSSSGLAGSYRSTFSSTGLDRPYYSTSSYSPRISSYSERFTTRSYTDVDGRRVYSRSGSITEDGVTTRFREESREGSLKRDSISRDSGIGSIDYPRRDNSLGRNDRLSTASVIDSVAELRNKYSPANYVPAIYRNKYENISRSKSINDIGLPPIEKSTASSKTKQANSTSNGISSGLGTKNGSSASLSNGSASPLSNGLCDDVTANSLQSKHDLQNGDGEDQIDGAELTSGGRRSTRVNQCASYIPSRSGANDEDGSVKEDKVTRSDSYSKLSNDASVSASTGAKGGGRAAPSPGPSRRSLIAPTDGDDDDADALDRRRGADGRQSTLGLIGLRNIGNTCFMNSVIQCLSNTRPLLEYLKKDGYLRDVNTTTSSMKGALIKAFAEVIHELWSGDSGERAVNTASLKSQIQRFAPRFMGYSQQDAQEFLRYLLEGLHEDVNRVTTKPRPVQGDIDDSLSDGEKASEAWRRYLRMDNSFIVDVFVGQLKSTLKCTHCGHCSVTFDPFWDLSLPLPPRSTGSSMARLSHCLDAFAKEETLDGDEKPTCAKCRERRKCTKSFAIQKFPQILVIHLKRFSPMERFRGKLNTLVEFPLDGLDLSPYAAEPAVASPRYALYAVSNHSGTTYSGHYTANCRHPYDLRWHEYNDSRVAPASARSAVSSEAYVLFYEQEGAQRSHL